MSHHYPNHGRFNGQGHTGGASGSSYSERGHAHPHLNSTLFASFDPVSNNVRTYPVGQRSIPASYEPPYYPPAQQQQTHVPHPAHAYQRLSEARYHGGHGQTHCSSHNRASPGSGSADLWRPPPLDDPGGRRWQGQPYYPSHTGLQISPASIDSRDFPTGLPHYQSPTNSAYPPGHNPPRAAVPTDASAHTHYQQSMAMGHAPLGHTIPSPRCATQPPYSHNAIILSRVPYDIPPEPAEPTIKKREREDARLEALNRMYARTAFTSTVERLQLAKDLDMVKCTGSFPFPRPSHTAVNQVVDDVMYAFGGLSIGEGYLDDFYALQLSRQRLFNFHNLGPSPHGRSAHAMASDATRVSMLEGYSKGAEAEQISFRPFFDTKDIDYPESEHNAVNPDETITQLVRKPLTGPPTKGQPQLPKSSPSEARGASRLQNTTPAVSGCPASLQITHERNPGPNGRLLELPCVNGKPRRVSEGDINGGSTEHDAKSATPHPTSGVTRLELERQLSVSLAVQTERGRRIAQLTDELALKSALLEQAEASAMEAARRAGPELREYTDDRRPMRTSLVKHRDVGPLDIQAKLDEVLLSHNQHIGQYEEELAIVRAKLEANESELEAVRLRLTEAGKSLNKSKAEAGFAKGDEDQVARRLMERVRAIEAEIVSKKWNEKSIEAMECRNEG